jgi:hypothetical protein
VKNISLESGVSNLLFTGVYSEIQREGFWVERKEKIKRCIKCDWDGVI